MRRITLAFALMLWASQVEARVPFTPDSFTPSVTAVFNDTGTDTFCWQCGDANPLLAAAHPQAMKFRAVEKLRENARDVLADDAGPVIRHGNAKFARLAGRDGLPVRHHLECDGHVRQDAGFFAGIERVIDRFLHTGQERFTRAVEAEQMPVLSEKFRNGDFPLARAHFNCGNLLCRLRGGFRWSS